MNEKYEVLYSGLLRDTDAIWASDLDEKVTTSKDWILTQLTGYGLYKGWLEEREGE